MTQKSPIDSSKHSLGKAVVKSVFTFYLLVAVIVTLVQMYVEFNRVQTTLLNEMRDVSQTISPGLSEQLWNIDDEGVARALSRIIVNEKIMGIQVFDTEGRQVSHAGEVTGNGALADSKPANSSGILNELFGIEFSIDYEDEDDGSLHEVGHGVIYTGSQVAFEQVKYGFILIIINSIIKTVALWLIAVYFINKIIERPLATLEKMIHHLHPHTSRNKVAEADSDEPLRARRDQVGRLFNTYDEMHEIIRRDFHVIEQKNEEIQADIIKRKRVEEELRYLRNYLENIIDSMPSAMIGVDNNGMITQWNLEANRMTDIPSEQAMGKPLAQAFPRLSVYMPKVHEAIRESHEKVDPKRSYQKNGETRYEDITIYPLVADGSEGAVIRVDEVTEQVRMEEMMIQTEKMLSVGGLAAGMAHEINSPLSGMMQTAHVMKNRLTDVSIPANKVAAESAGLSMEAIHEFMADREIIRMIDSIRSSGRRVAAIIDNMLSFARKSNAATSSHDMDELLERTLELAATDYDLKKEYDFKTLNIERRYAKNIPPVPCEKAKIQQVILNILRNGAEAMQEASTTNPTFTLHTRYDRGRSMVCVDIEDNGPGMDETIRRRVFEPFFTTKPEGVGTGLGLSVSYFIISENHGGEMSVASELGLGTRFSIGLPLSVEVTGESVSK